MILFYDTSGAGKVSNWKAKSDDTTVWPRLMHLAWQAYDDDRKLLSFGNKIIKPEHFKISSAISRHSGVSQEIALKKGVDLKDTLKEFNEVIKKSKKVITFNKKYNQGILLAEYLRAKMPTQLDTIESYCLMQESSYFCKLPARYGGYKWPTLAELHAKTFQARLEGLNQADTDVIASVACFYRLVDLGKLDDILED